MPKVVILGSANAVPDEKHENTHMAVVGKRRTLLIDSVGNPVVRLSQAGIPLDSITDLLITHFHPDHVSGVPMLLMSMWLLGRKQPLEVYGLEHALVRLQDLMNAYDWQTWPGFFPVNFHAIPAVELAPVMENDEWRLFASPVNHLIPTIGLRFEFLPGGVVFAYSCDTSPCGQVVKLARGAQVLIHEASGDLFGHSSATQAAEIAQESGVGELYLIHYPTMGYDTAGLVQEAGQHFSGPVKLAEDFMVIEVA